MPTIRTVATVSRFEIPRIKGSRFFATVFPAQSVDQAKVKVAELWAEFPDATHHCWAFRGRTRDVYRYADDGEPSGSAGKPILAAIDGQTLSDVGIVVTRYFGGTKLGTGGLVRAYGQTAAEAIAHATIITSQTTTRLKLRHTYTRSGAVEAVLHAFGLLPASATYTDTVTLELDVPDEQVEGLCHALNERTSGQVELEVSRTS